MVTVRVSESVSERFVSVNSSERAQRDADTSRPSTQYGTTDPSGQKMYYSSSRKLTVSCPTLKYLLCRENLSDEVELTSKLKRD